jgi:hypothetical protein
MPPRSCRSSRGIAVVVTADFCRSAGRAVTRTCSFAWGSFTGRCRVAGEFASRHPPECATDQNCAN